MFLFAREHSSDSGSDVEADEKLEASLTFVKTLAIAPGLVCESQSVWLIWTVRCWLFFSPAHGLIEPNLWEPPRLAAGLICCGSWGS